MAYIERLEDSLKYRSYRQGLEASGLQVNALRPLEVIRRRNGEVLFAFMDLDAQTPDGTWLPPNVLLRGAFASVLVVLQDPHSHQRFALVVQQRRVATGGFFTEHPAGMMDQHTDPRHVALKEVEEETGLKLKLNELVPLFDRPIFTSPGLLDEAGHCFFVERMATAGERAALERPAGQHTEGESTLATVWPLRQVLHQFVHANGLLMLYRYLHLRGIDPQSL